MLHLLLFPRLLSYFLLKVVIAHLLVDRGHFLFLNECLLQLMLYHLPHEASGAGARDSEPDLWLFVDKLQGSGVKQSYLSVLLRSYEQLLLDDLELSQLPLTDKQVVDLSLSEAGDLTC